MGRRNGLRQIEAEACMDVTDTEIQIIIEFEEAVERPRIRKAVIVVHEV